MASANYYSVDGEILGERLSNAGVDYLTDALGSVALATDGSTNTSTTYTPYGNGNAPLGASFGWVGSLGYRPTAVGEASHFVRRRHFAARRARWTSRDPLWPVKPPYGYAGSRPLSKTDPRGTQEGGKLPEIPGLYDHSEPIFHAASCTDYRDSGCMAQCGEDPQPPFNITNIWWQNCASCCIEMYGTAEGASACWEDFCDQGVTCCTCPSPEPPEDQPPAIVPSNNQPPPVPNPGPPDYSCKERHCVDVANEICPHDIGCSWLGVYLHCIGYPSMPPIGYPALKTMPPTRF